MSKVGLMQVITAEITGATSFAGKMKEGQLLLDIDADKLASRITDAVIDYIKKEFWLAIKSLVVEHILS